MANTLSPEFTPDRVKIGAGADWVKRYAGSTPWATPDSLRELIGPNWIPVTRSQRIFPVSGQNIVENRFGL
jgi:hypothetical protein